MKLQKYYPLAIVLLVIVIAIPTNLFCLNSKTTILLVRHAEKASAASNSNLSAAGSTRAQALLASLKDAGVRAIYTTEFCRTAQTAQPLASQLALPLIVQANNRPNNQLSDSECEPDIEVPVEVLSATIDSVTELVDEILAKNSGKVVLVVGHSDTIPQIIAELGAPPLCPEYFPLSPTGVCTIPDAQFDNIFTVTVHQFFGEPQIIRAKYGVASVLTLPPQSRLQPFFHLRPLGVQNGIKH